MTDKLKGYVFDKSKYAIVNDGLIRVNLETHVVIPKDKLGELLKRNDVTEIIHFLYSSLMKGNKS